MHQHDSLGSDSPCEPSTRRGRPPRRFRALVVVAATVVGTLAAAPVSAEVLEHDHRRHDRRVEVLELGCEGRDREVAAIGCRWSVPKDAVGVKLVRAAVGSDAGRVMVFRTDDPTQNSHVDTPVRRGVRYVYAVRAVDVDGRIVGASRPVTAGVPLGDPPAVEALRLRCEPTGATTARCGWTLPDSQARVLTLWRSVDGAARERVASFGAPLPTSYGDEVAAGSSRAVYAVIATDGDGEIVARSRADGVAFPDADPPVDSGPPATRPVETRPVDTRPVETRPVETRPVETRPVETRPVETRPVETRPVDTRPAPARDGDRTD